MGKRQSRDTNTRLGLIGDVHCEDELLERALTALHGLGVHQVLVTGDLVDGPGDPNRCIALLEEAGALVIRGNHERWMMTGVMRELDHATAYERLSDRAVQFIHALPATRDVTTSSGRLLLCHGTGRNDMCGVTPEDSGYALTANTELQSLLASQRYWCMVAGHTHRRMVRRVGSLTLINAGTLAREHDPCFGLLDLEREHIAFRSLSVDGDIGTPEIHRIEDASVDMTAMFAVG